MKPLWILLTSALGLFYSSAVSQPFSSEVSLTIDNDAFLFSAIDRYYSSGLFATFKKQTGRPTQFIRRFYPHDTTARESYSGQLAHVFYTAYNPRWSDPTLFDRPYAGWIYAQAAWQGTGQTSAVKLSADIGVLGPATKIEPLQHWWHDIFDFRKPKGWDYQINNTPSIHTSLHFLKRLAHHHSAEIYWESQNRLGTVLTQSANGIALRIGQLQPLPASVWGNNRIGNRIGSNKTQTKKMDEFFVFIKETARYRIYDATVEGNFIGRRSIYTGILTPWLFHHQLGLCMAWNRFDLMLAHNVTSGETDPATFHQYTTFDFFYRF